MAHTENTIRGGAKSVIFSIRGGGGGLAPLQSSGSQLSEYPIFLLLQKGGGARPGCPPLYEPLNIMHTFFLPGIAKGTSEVTQNAQFILRGLIPIPQNILSFHSDSDPSQYLFIPIPPIFK